MLNWLGQVVIRIEHDWYKNYEKKIGKDLVKSNLQKSLKQWIFFNFLDLTCSIYDQNITLMIKELKAAHTQALANWKILIKTEIWFQGSRAIQGSILVSIASLDNSEGVPIPNNNKSAKNWYSRVPLNQENIEIASHDLSIFLHFCLYIITPYEVSVLTI